MHKDIPLGLDPSSKGEYHGRTFKHDRSQYHQRDCDISNGDHCHRQRGNMIDYRARRKLILVSILCLMFMIGEVIGGWLSNSLAIATDAAHLLTDFASFMISLFALWVSTKPPTRRMSFGWYRAEVVGALTSVLLIWVVTAILVYWAVLRIINDEYEIDAIIMLITSGAGVLVNLIMGATLHEHGHGHSHGGPSVSSENIVHHDDEEAQGLLGGDAKFEKHSKIDNINVRAAFIHVLGDFIQSVGVFVAALTIYFKPEWRIIDPICTFLFSVLVLLTTLAIMRDTMQVLMEAMPKGVEFSKVLETLQQSPGVLRVHNLRVWALTMDKVALTAHLVIEPGTVAEKVLRCAEASVRSRFSVFEMTLQVEPFEQSMDCCDQCLCPEN